MMPPVHPRQTFTLFGFSTTLHPSTITLVVLFRFFRSRCGHELQCSLLGVPMIIFIANHGNNTLFN